MKKLVIVESPNKVNKIKKFLNDDLSKDSDEYEVVSSVGHIRELSTRGKYGLGIDLETMTPVYKVPTEKKKIITEINKAAKDANLIYLATDPDREGESIAWHIKEIIKDQNKQFERIIFNEITKEAIKDSIDHPVILDQNLINSQEARRMLDRIIGFRLSFLTKKKISAKSSGRVKSSVLKMIIDRENEINKFIPEVWFNLEAKYQNSTLKLVDNKYKEIKTQDEIYFKEILNSLDPNNFVLKDTKETFKMINPPEPIEMSSLLIKSYSILGYSNATTTSLAQTLYEKGLITYPRTDSKRISSTAFLDQAKLYIETKLQSKFNLKIAVSKNSQDAHEAIRPVDVFGETIQNELATLKPREKKLYNLIQVITLQSFMDSAKSKSTKFIYENNNHLFAVSQSEIVEQGFKKIDLEKDSLVNDLLPKLLKIKSEDIKIVRHETKPPARYNQASLVKKMKEEGIGRPSTYSSTTTGLIKYNYVTSEKGILIPTEMGKEVTNLLLSSFSDIINEKYTSFLEEELDKISVGNVNHKNFLLNFWKEFEHRVDLADETIEKKMPEFVNRKCPSCDGELVYKVSRYGSKFIACLNFPECRYSESLVKKEIEYANEKCPNCGGELVYRVQRKTNKKFIGCLNFPKCNYIRTLENQDSKEKKTKEPSIEK